MWKCSKCRENVDGSLDVFRGTFDEWVKSEQDKTELQRAERVSTSRKQTLSNEADTVTVVCR